MKNFFNVFSYYLIAPIIAFSILLFYFDFNIFKYGESILFIYTGDGLFAEGIFKLIIKEGLTYCSKYVGYPQIDTNCFSDYASNNGYLSFLIVRFFAIFINSPLTVTYYQFLLSIFLITISANFCLRKIGISKFNATFLAVLFAITNNRILYFYTLSIGNYFIIPFAVLMSLWIMEGKLNIVKINENGKRFFSPNRYFYYCCIIGSVGSISSAYYGYACIILLLLSGFILFIRDPKFDKKIFSIAMTAFILTLISMLINLSTIIFWIKNGFNDVVGRQPIEGVYHSMSISALLLPINEHALKGFADFSAEFKKIFLFSGEKHFHQFGLFSSIGFCSLLAFALSLQFLVYKKDPKYRFYGIEFSKEKYYILGLIASLNLVFALFFSTESFYLFLQYFFANIRGLIRLNVVFTFLALTFFGIIFDELIAQKKIFKNTIFTKVLIIIICAVALIDGVGGPTRISKSFESEKKNYELSKDFVENIEKSLPMASKIFMMPIKGFPEFPFDDYKSTIGYIFSEDLKFSYPSPMGRKSYLWQREVADLEFKDFIKKIKEQGFAGIWIQRDIFENIEKKIKLKDFENNIKKIAKNSIESRDKIFIFYEI